MDWNVIDQKLESLRRSLRRIQEKCPRDADALKKDYDAQDILALNLTRAVQICVDIGANLISGIESPPPDTMGQVFDILCDAGIIHAELAERMKRSVGFRNIAVHNYETIDWLVVHSIARNCPSDFEAFARAVMEIQNRGK